MLDSRGRLQLEIYKRHAHSGIAEV